MRKLPPRNRAGQFVARAKPRHDIGHKQTRMESGGRPARRASDWGTRRQRVTSIRRERRPLVDIENL